MLGDLDDLVDATRERDFALEDVRLDPVIPEPGQILCIGLNYEEHRIETRRERSGYPTVFARFGRSQVGDGGDILRPPESAMLDFEGELAIIIGGTVRRCDEASAMNFVAGYACYNDASIRDFQRHTSQFHPGKNFPATGAFGPWMVTTDEVPDYRSLSIQTRLNGEIVQAAGLDQLIFTIPELIAYCSTFTELRAGDVIVTGTPGGVGSGRTPPLWMKAGDVVEVEVSGVGTLRNRVSDECGQSS
ncbi:MAG: fumarylacetoacetate hydrolase family protein [Pseudomonadota bacterium]